MRITGGRARGIPLKAPKGDRTRPATDRMREAVFSSLGPAVEGARVADLFAGTGAYGLEALSRGAAGGLFIENNRAALACLRENLAAVCRSCQSDTNAWTIRTTDLFAAGPPDATCDLIFIDPPYDSLAQDLDRIFSIAGGLAAPNANILLELPGDLKPAPAGWTPLRRFGKGGRDKPTAILFARTR